MLIPEVIDIFSTAFNNFINLVPFHVLSDRKATVMPYRTALYSPVVKKEFGWETFFMVGVEIFRLSLRHSDKGNASFSTNYRSKARQLTVVHLEGLPQRKAVYSPLNRPLKEGLSTLLPFNRFDC